MNEPDLRQVLASVGVEPLGRSAAGWLSARCPFAPFYHAGGVDGRPSFFAKINAEGTSGYYCHSCGQKGGIISLPRRLGRLLGEDYREESMRAALLENLGGVSAWSDSYGLGEIEELDSNLVLHLYPLADEVPESRAYLELRGCLGAQNRLALRYDEKDRRIMFPVFGGDGALYGFTGRSILKEREYPYQDYPKVRDYFGLPKSQLILGEHLWEAEKPILIVEGLFAVARALSTGADRIWNVGATMGAVMSEAQARIIASHDSPVYLMYDDDLAGDQGIYGRDAGRDKGALGLLSPHVPCYVCYYPEGRNDVDLLTRRDWGWVYENAEPCF